MVSSWKSLCYFLRYFPILSPGKWMMALTVCVAFFRYIPLQVINTLSPHPVPCCVFPTTPLSPYLLFLSLQGRSILYLPLLHSHASFRIVVTPLVDVDMHGIPYYIPYLLRQIRFTYLCLAYRM